ncbi:MAG: CinA family protein [Thermoplasmata archaeon]|nr:CinA family protein [Thermoplasmata archaeon]
MGKIEIELGELLIKRNLTLATAESCTGGFIADMITNVSGSSRYFERGVITYSNESKIELLKVPVETIEKFGAVSEESATAMATGIKELARTDLGLAVTGIAGPSGGTPEKPVGLLYIALASENKVEAFKFNFHGTRLEIKQQTANTALEIVINHLTQ